MSPRAWHRAGEDPRRASTLRISMDPAQAGAPISYWGDERWITTPYQTADARHRPGRALALVRRWLGS